MKKTALSIILLALFLGSCATRRITTEPMRVYKRGETFCMTSAEYLIIKKGPREYSYYIPLLDVNIFGTYTLSGDTICLYPKYETYSKIIEIDSSNISIITIPQYFIIEGNSLREITDYWIYPEFAISGGTISRYNNEVYHELLFYKTKK